MEGKHQCPICSKTFGNERYLRRHARIHTDDKPFKCDTCESCFLYQSNLRRHQAAHSDERPYKCNYEGCKWSFKQNYELSRHVYRMHPQEILSKTSPNDPKIESRRCDICGKLFYCPAALRIHSRRHTKERPFFCKFCNCTFPYQTSLYKHIKRIHSKEETLSSCQHVKDDIKDVVSEKKENEFDPCCSAAIRSEEAQNRREENVCGMTSDAWRDAQVTGEDIYLETDAEQSTCFDLFPEVRIDRYELECVLCRVKFDDEVSMREHAKKYH
ncbi:zinc finger protein 454-like isoform X2 [Centruroides sculpturatus]|uniref:zinc finger protein 454-like isoform X2 n=2 Tax=Centruroides sculpturatus TaxID=218467 RepID=UPI000C6CD0D4|nr:zinc finger protein 454-like isoform X2 [Centruroides sculpturatus]